MRNIKGEVKSSRDLWHLSVHWKLHGLVLEREGHATYLQIVYIAAADSHGFDSDPHVIGTCKGQNELVGQTIVTASRSGEEEEQEEEGGQSFTLQTHETLFSGSADCSAITSPCNDVPSTAGNSKGSIFRTFTPQTHAARFGVVPLSACTAASEPSPPLPILNPVLSHHQPTHSVSPYSSKP